MPFIALMAIAAVGIFGYQLWEWSLPEETPVPVVVGLQQDDAISKLQHAGLRVDVYQYQQASETFPAGSVITSDPAGGRKVKEGRQVRLIISSGTAYTKVPDICELSLLEAKDRLRVAHLTVASETYAFNGTIPFDRVIGVTPAPGTRLQRNSSVALNLSKGKQQRVAEDSMAEDEHSTTLSVELPLDAEKPEQVRIDVIDDNGRNTVYEREHNPGDTVVYTVQGIGKTVSVEVFFGTKLLLTRKL